MPQDKPPSSDDASRAAFAAALRMLALRDLSEAQLRERLQRKDFPPDAVDAAVARLTQEGAIDDRRTAVSRARTELFVRGRGRLRVLQQLRAIGIAPETAEEALADAIGDLDETTLVERALNRRSRGRVVRIEDQGEFRRLYRCLAGQGFSASAIMPVLRARSRRSFEPQDDT
jgi:regulatory protein